MKLSGILSFLIAFYLTSSVNSFRARHFQHVNKTQALQNFRDIHKQVHQKTDADIDRLIEKVKKFKSIKGEQLLNETKTSNTIIPTKKSVTLIDPDTSPNPVVEAVDFGKVNQGLLDVLVEGDIVPTEEQIDEWTNHALGNPSRAKRQMTTKYGNWPLKPNVIAYYFDSSFTDTTFQNMVRDGFKFWQNITCLAYVENSAATDRIKPTMVALKSQYQKTMGGAFKPSIEDIRLVNMHYGCTCSVVPSCLNGGIPNPNNCATCICPSGFSGALCTDRDPGTYACGDILASTTTWQTLTGSMTIPGAFDSSKPIQTCYWHITSPPGTQIQIQVKSLTSNIMSDSAISGGFEVVYENIRLGGARFGHTRDESFGTVDLSSTPVMKSSTNLVVIHLWNMFDTTSFVLDYQYVAGAPTTTTSTTTTTTTTTTTPPKTTTTTTTSNPAKTTTITSAPCPEDSRCATWASNGFCSNTFYTLAQRQSYCPNTCKLGCGAAPVPPTCVDNASCVTWNNNGFCASTFYTIAQKKQYCPNQPFLTCH
uniref:Metalloendopeptidase n=1 Tax=Acrobeloides nanus TaxID=290746 RepID=A0A914DWA7_9BILA